jgi:hypothetical protein
MRRRELVAILSGPLDVAVLVVFVLIGRKTHAADHGVGGFFRVWWPFAAGLATAYVVTGVWLAPLRWARAVPAWLVTVAVGMGLRVGTSSHRFKVSFTIVALVFVGFGMLGWRAIAASRRFRPRSRRPLRRG